MGFRSRLALLFGTLFVLSLATVLFTIERIARSNALQQISENLSATVTTVQILQTDRARNIQQDLQLLAGDYAFKSVYASRDEPTIRSALHNYQNRLTDVNMIVLCDLDERVLSNTRYPEMNDLPFPLPEILQRADESESGETIAFGVLDDVLYQFVVTPLLAPDIEAWIIGGFRLDDPRTEKFSDLTGSEISLFLKLESETRLVASSLDSGKREALQSLPPRHSQGELPEQLQIGDETYIGQELDLNPGSSPGVSALVQRSLDAALAPYRSLSRYVTWIFLLGICLALLAIIMLSNRVTHSLRTLSQGALSISQGELGTRVEVRGHDEFAQLAETFNDMTRGLAEKEHVRDLLGKVVSPEIAAKLVREGLELGGEERRVTVLFCDLQGFTPLAESLPPTQVLNALNTFFSGISAIIEAHGGVVDKYIGDAVMGLFGAPMDDPLHAANAVACGIEICAQADRLLADLGDGNEVRCGFGVGIHSGMAVAGNVGSSTRLNYTVIGDTVNVASRVEGQTRVFEQPLLITRATVELCKDDTFHKLGSAQLKGRKEAIELYTSGQAYPQNPIEG